MSDGGWPEVLAAWLGAIGGLATILGAVFGAIAVYLTLEYVAIPVKERRLLGMMPRREDAAATLRRRGWSETYTAALAGGLRSLARLYGERPGGWYALAISSVLALAYGWALFCLMWAFGASDGTVLTQTVLEPLQQAVRLPLGLQLAVLPPGFFLFFRWWTPRASRWQERLERRWRDEGRSRSIWGLRTGFGVIPAALILAESYLSNESSVNGLIAAFSVIFAFTFAFAGPGTVTVAAGFAVTVTAAFGGALFGPVAIVFILAVVVGIIGAFGAALGTYVGETNLYRLSTGQFVGSGILCLVLVALGLLLGGTPETSIVLISFFGILPLFNGLADWLSLWASRRLGEHLRGTVQGETLTVGRLVWAMIWHIVFDLAAAVGLLCGLAFVIAFAMQRISDWRGFGFDVAGEIATAAAHPFGQGFWFTAMLFSTLIPTVLHFVMLAASPVMLRRPDAAERDRWAERLEAADFDNDRPEDQAVVVKVARWQTFALWSTGGGFVVVVLVLAGLVWGLSAEGMSPADGVAWVANQGVAWARAL